MRMFSKPSRMFLRLSDRCALGPFLQRDHLGEVVQQGATRLPHASPRWGAPSRRSGQPRAAVSFRHSPARSYFSVSRIGPQRPTTRLPSSGHSTVRLCIGFPQGASVAAGGTLAPQAAHSSVCPLIPRHRSRPACTAGRADRSPCRGRLRSPPRLPTKRREHQFVDGRLRTSTAYQVRANCLARPASVETGSLRRAWKRGSPSRQLRDP